MSESSFPTSRYDFGNPAYNQNAPPQNNLTEASSEYSVGSNPTSLGSFENANNTLTNNSNSNANKYDPNRFTRNQEPFLTNYTPKHNSKYSQYIHPNSHMIAQQRANQKQQQQYNVLPNITRSHNTSTGNTQISNPTIQEREREFQKQQQKQQQSQQKSDRRTRNDSSQNRSQLIKEARAWARHRGRELSRERGPRSTDHLEDDKYDFSGYDNNSSSNYNRGMPTTRERRESNYSKRHQSNPGRLHRPNNREKSDELKKREARVLSMSPGRMRSSVPVVMNLNQYDNPSIQTGNLFASNTQTLQENFQKGVLTKEDLATIDHWSKLQRECNRLEMQLSGLRQEKDKLNRQQKIADANEKLDLQTIHPNNFQNFNRLAHPSGQSVQSSTSNESGGTEKQEKYNAMIGQIRNNLSVIDDNMAQVGQKIYQLKSEMSILDEKTVRKIKDSEERRKVAQSQVTFAPQTAVSSYTIKPAVGNNNLANMTYPGRRSNQSSFGSQRNEVSRKYKVISPSQQNYPVKENFVFLFLRN